LLILISLIYACFGIFGKISKYGFGSSEGAEILQIVEYVLFYLLPLLFLIGLFGFYKNSLQNYFVPKEYHTDPNESIRTFNISKKIFLSSVLSYVIIKVIEEVFFIKNNEIENLISYGVLLFLLMTFILIYHKFNHVE
jgi:hypothetical protein